MESVERRAKHEDPRYIKEKTERFGAEVFVLESPFDRIRPDIPFEETRIEDIVYKTPDGATLSFRSLLPEGWRLSEMRMPTDMGAENFTPITERGDRCGAGAGLLRKSKRACSCGFGNIRGLFPRGERAINEDYLRRGGGLAYRF